MRRPCPRDAADGDLPRVQRQSVHVCSGRVFTGFSSSAYNRKTQRVRPIFHVLKHRGFHRLSAGVGTKGGRGGPLCLAETIPIVLLSRTLSSNIRANPDGTQLWGLELCDIAYKASGLWHLGSNHDFAFVCAVDPSCAPSAPRAPQDIKYTCHLVFRRWRRRPVRQLWVR